LLYEFCFSKVREAVRLLRDGGAVALRSFGAVVRWKFVFDEAYKCGVYLLYV